jgi:acetyl-CoA C-acetyltransferase
VKEAAIVSTARTPIGKAYRGAFNNTEAPTLASHAIRQAVNRAGVAPDEVDDVVMGCAMQQGSSGQNVARQSSLAAGLPVTVPGMSVDRQCSSGMMAIAIAAKQVLEDNMPVVVGGGLESISLVQNEHYNRYRASDPNVLEAAPDIYMSMLDTAEVVTKRYGISREQQDEFGLRSQQRTAAAQEAGAFDDEIPEDGVRKRQHHGGQCQPVIGWRLRRCRHGQQAGGKTRPRAAWHLSWYCGCRNRAR